MTDLELCSSTLKLAQSQLVLQSLKASSLLILKPAVLATEISSKAAETALVKSLRSILKPVVLATEIWRAAETALVRSSRLILKLDALATEISSRAAETAPERS